jgi:hypothetical protein
MEKIPEPTDEFSVMSMETSKIVSPISQVDDMWLTIARDSMLHWDKISREATLHWQEKSGLLKKDEIVSEHIADSLQQVMPPTTIDFAHDTKFFAVPLPLSNPAISTSIPLVMPPSTNLLSDLDSSDIIVDVTMTSLKKPSSSIDEVTGLKKISSSVYEVAPQLDIL